MTTPFAIDQITDEYMDNRLSQAKTYALMVLKPTPKYFTADSRPIVKEHGRRNMALQAAGIMPIVCPVGGDEISGIGIFSTDPDETRRIMSDDPGVRAGVFTFEVHVCRGFPGDA
ncbi:MAG: hypothetical protein J2P57_22835, partial [Acidimicrobiaceae bacterium]|nr:hypothetical protein [Acidimicrobiaceae bacterium]